MAVPRVDGAAVPRLHLITDDDVLARADFRDVAGALMEAAGAGVALHLRGPHTGGRVLHAAAAALRETARASGAWLVVNDRVDVALTAGLDAVQLGRRSLPPAAARRVLGSTVRVGVSTHVPQEVTEAVVEGADWIFVGTMYATPSHPGREGSGPAGMRAAAAVAGRTPLVAIGGVTVARVPELLRSGAHGVAVVRGVWQAPDPRTASRDYLEALASGSCMDGAGDG
jgi:thiamine-phosphate pyrophosphorylase